VKDQLETIEAYVTDVILHGRRGFFASFWRTVFWCLAKVYSVVMQLRLYLYKKRYIRPAHIGIPVISIGNLSVGGTGKTPVVELLARTLKERGRRVAILSRGYKSKAPPHRPFWQRFFSKLGLVSKPPRPPVRIVSNEHEVLLGSEEAGDEPCMLARNLHGVPVLVDKNRVRAGKEAIRLFKPDVLLLDDGMQYLKLKHRLDVVLVDSTKPLSAEHLLPRGTLREPPSHLRRASYIFLTKCDGSDKSQLIQELRRYNRTAEILECRHRPLHFKDMHTGEVVPIEDIQKKRVGAISGIAVPESFESGLEKLRAKIEARLRFTDHHRFTADEVKPFIERCIRKDLDYIITTEKDMVRFPVTQQPEIPILYMRVQIEILRGQEVFDKMIQLITEPRSVPPGVVLMSSVTQNQA
jgi:tetraacyldisaccharide 4'-kinase